MNYKYPYKADEKNIYQVLMDEQLKYFQRNDPNIIELTSGTKIQCDLATKSQRAVIPSTIEVKQVVRNKIFQLETTHNSGKILQTYEFSVTNKGKGLLIYSEKNSFSEIRNQYNFMIAGLIYKFFYNRGIAKRMKYIDELALNIS